MGQLRLGSRPTIAKTVLAINNPVPEFGGTYISGTNLFTPDTETPTNQATRGWAQVQILTATVFDTATKCNIANLAGATIPAGTTLYGIFSQIKLSSGTAVGYFATEQP